MNPGDWWPCYSADTSEAKARELAAKKLEVPEKRVEVDVTDGAVLTRERQEKRDG